MTCTQAARYAYVANTQANTIAAFIIDSSTGFLTPVPRSPFPAIGTSPTALAVDPNGVYLYSANSATNSISVHTINDATGALNPVSSSIPTGVRSTGVVVDPSGQHLYVENSGGNTVSAFTSKRHRHTHCRFTVRGRSTGDLSQTECPGTFRKTRSPQSRLPMPRYSPVTTFLDL